MIRVLLVDDQALVRSGFRVILETEPDIEVVGEAADGAVAVELAATLMPDVICMDVEMPVMNGIEASRRILLPRAPGGAGGSGSGRAPSILVLTTFGHEEYLFDALQAGVSGFLLKTSRAEQLVEAVRALAAGQALLGPDVTRSVMERAAGLRQEPGAEDRGASVQDGPAPGGSSADAAMEAAGLTEREREVLGLVARGRSNAEIAAELFLGEATVKTHVSNILQKLGARDRIQIVVWAHTHGATAHDL
ncbi:MAG: response regulator [Leucobacter sp.]